eukprot:scaffold1404_cov173-Ochromonas_danica.AAC.7
MDRQATRLLDRPPLTPKPPLTTTPPSPYPLDRGANLVQLYPDPVPVETFLNFNIHTARGISLPMYSSVGASFEFRARIKKVVQVLKPCQHRPLSSFQPCSGLKC